MITRDQVRQLYDYDPEIGVFTHRATIRRGIAGSPAGELLANGYIRLSIAGERHRAHRIAWLWVHGELPEQQVDHINGDKTDNRIANLRLATPAQNKQNLRKPLSTNTSGFLGVSYSKARGKFIAAITKDGRTKNLGGFDTAEEAHQRYLEAKREHHDFATI